MSGNGSEKPIQTLCPNVAPSLSLHSPSGPESRGALRARGDPPQERSAASGDPETERGAERSHYRGGGAGEQHRGQVSLASTCFVDGTRFVLLVVAPVFVLQFAFSDR